MSDLNMRKVLFIGGSCTSGSCSVPLEEWAFHLIYEYYILTAGKLETKDTWKGGDTSHPSLTVVTFDPIRLLFGKFSCRQKDFFPPHRVVFCGYLSGIWHYSIIKRLRYLGHSTTYCSWSQAAVAHWRRVNVLQSPGETIRLHGFLQAKQRSNNEYSMRFVFKLRVEMSRGDKRRRKGPWTVSYLVQF